jgi:hypothetical protein
VSCVAWLGARYANLKGVQPYWGFAFALYPGFLLTISRDTTEIIATCLMMASILFLTLGQNLVSAVVLTFAIFAKETVLVLAIAILIYSLFYRVCKIEKRALFFLLPIFAYIAWQVWLSFHWRESLPQVGFFTTKIGIPFLGLGRFLLSIFPPASARQLIWLVEVALILALAIWILSLLVKSTSLPALKFSWLLCLLLLVSFTGAIWVEDWSFLRILSEFWLLGMIIAIEAPPVRIKNFIPGLVALSWVLLALDISLVR